MSQARLIGGPPSMGEEMTRFNKLQQMFSNCPRD
jgi:hypothetical protein